MIYWTIKTIIISIIFIFLIHHLIEFFKNTLTVPKVKDLVNVPTQKYEHIFNVISKNNYDNSIDKITEKTISNQSTNINNLPIVDNDMNMKNELKKFLKQQMTNNIYNS
jgi:Fe-S cluster biosynthesis and repair protein YggX